ncbi:hypothetical protein [Rhizobium sullae]|uniref:hypothetical protein n=1 Tax=Rhizobium sullae TaxID=50338 RepID=UPI0012FD0BBC|nr:hypothetical protein [Rhizobium sullae]
MSELIKIAADDVSKLRKSDVFRVLDCAGGERLELALFIIANRPELREEVDECLADLAA